MASQNNTIAENTTVGGDKIKKKKQYSGKKGVNETNAMDDEAKVTLDIKAKVEDEESSEIPKSSDLSQVNETTVILEANETKNNISENIFDVF